MKVLILTKKRIAAIFGCLILTVALIFAMIPKNIVATSNQTKKLPIYAVSADKKEVCLTFDAAWDDSDTQQLIDIFKKYNVKATFFVVGEWVDKYPGSVKALSDAGHSINNHSDTHRHMPKLTRNEIKDEITKCNEKITAVTGTRPLLVRPPYGDYDNKTIEAAESLDMYSIQWDVDSLDWKGISADEIKNRVLSSVQSGSIILFHNGAKHTPEALPGIIEALQKDGYKLVTVNELIYKKDYEIDSTGRQKQIKTQNTTAAPVFSVNKAPDDEYEMVP